MDYPIRILCVFSTLDRGGAETMAMSLFRKINRDKVIFDFVKHTRNKGAYEDEIRELGGKIFEAPRYRGVNHIQYVRWWRSFLKAHPEYLIVHGHYFTISSVYFSAAHKENRITIGHSHCTDVAKDQISHPFAHWLANKLLIGRIEKNSDYCMACSIDAGNWIFKNKGFKVLNNAIEVEKFKSNYDVGLEVREELNLGSCFVIGNVSRFNIQKNPFGTLEIFRLVHQRRTNCKLLWAGDGPLREKVQKKAVEYGLMDDIIFTGSRSDVHRLLQAMDVFIFPSFFEGLGIAAVEAQAAGVTTICSTAIPNDVAVTDRCFFLPLDQLDMWADEICQLGALQKHRDMTDRIKRSGYDINDTSKWLQEFYVSLVENGGFRDNYSK